MEDTSALTYKLIGLAMNVHSTLGPGFTEYVYQDAFEIELMQAGIDYVREAKMRVFYKGKPLYHTYDADFLIENKLIFEFKSAKAIAPEHVAQLLNYLKAGEVKTGYLINFGEPSLKFKRYTFNPQTRTVTEASD